MNDIAEHTHRPFEDPYQDVLNADIEKRLAEIQAIRSHHEKYCDLYRPVVLRFAQNDSATIRASETGVDIALPGTKADLAEAVRTLRSNGFSPSNRPTDGATEWMTFLGHKTDSRAQVWFNFSSVQCQRIQVGTELREVPVYEIQCSESLEDFS